MNNALEANTPECLEYVARVEETRLWYARIRRGNMRAEHEALVQMLSVSPLECRDAVMRSYVKFVPPSNLRSLPLFRQILEGESIDSQKYVERRYNKLLSLMQRRAREAEMEATVAMFR